jgi:hypothetical protein
MKWLTCLDDFRSWLIRELPDIADLSALRNSKVVSVNRPRAGAV